MREPPSWIRRAADALLTTDPVQRMRLSQAGLAMLLMAVSVAVMHYVVFTGDAHAGFVWWWTLFALGGLALFFVAIRSGATLRRDDPSLTLPQIVYAIAVAAAAYALAGPMRGAVFPLLGVTLMFGMFQLHPRVVAWTSVYAVSLFGVVMAFMSWRAPAVYRPEVEFSHFLIVAATIPAVSLLAGRLSRMRERQRRQKRELAIALGRIQELATRDQLTGLVNRRHMLELLEQERQRCVRSGRTFCIALIDVDHFKRVNDSVGHAAGDEVLRTFAREAQRTIRVADVLARWGGEEFVLMLSDTHATLARGALERLRERIAAMVVNANGVEVRITVSAGLTEHIAGETVPQALERADRALYEAKAQGRDRVQLA
jgi:diguanylate cyclase (GGDEF)-like protein